ncbi:MAG: serine hydrolase domain-containing protein [Parvularcula sp.]|jgi:CubicO group peptidase (beta-lactamase class C family)|nr:serine hydrolase domain-containing protein [Parvularcula sp.]
MRKLALCLLATGCAVSSPADRASDIDAMSEAKLAHLEEMVPIWLEEHDVPSAAVAYIAGGEIAFTRVWGEQSPGVPATRETLYNVASLSKPVVAETVLRLADEGRIDLDEPLANYWIEPDVEDDPRSRILTARIVLKHETGLPNWRWATDGVLQFIAEPDEGHSYSGEGFEWMAKAISIKLDTPFGELARTYVLRPNGMDDTAFSRKDWFEGRLAEPYMKDQELPNAVQEEFLASDDMRTTPDDYAAFLIDVMNGGGVSPDLAKLRTAITRHWSWLAPCADEATSTVPCPTRMGWTTGWLVFDYGDETVVFHSGGDYGEKTIAFFSPERREGVVVFTNGAEGHHLLHKIPAALYGEEGIAALMDPNFK